MTIGEWFMTILLNFLLGVGAGVIIGLIRGISETLENILFLLGLSALVYELWNYTPREVVKDLNIIAGLSLIYGSFLGIDLGELIVRLWKLRLKDTSFLED